MRIRISLQPPLPLVKAWFLIPTTVTTIQDLKIALSDGLPQLHSPVSLTGKSSDAKRRRDAVHKILLEVDGFELLDTSEIAVLMEDRDVVW